MMEEEEKKSRSRRISIYEGSAFSIMDGFGFRYISPYAVALGAGNTIIGLLTTLPVLLGNAIQLISIKLLGKYSRKKIVGAGVLFQCIFWIPLILTGILYLLDKISAGVASIFVLAFYSLMITAGSFANPIWNSWMRDLVPEKSGDYFGKRNAVIGAVALVAMIIAGFILDYFRESGKLIIGFSILFAVALLGRSISLIFMNKQYEPEYKHDQSMYFSFKDFLKKMSSNNFGRFALFTTIFNLGVAISSPFLAVYMLKNLGFENIYIAFTIVIMAPILSGLISSKYWGKAIDKYGNISILKITAFLISFGPLAWTLSYFLIEKSIYVIVSYLVFIEILSGIFWAGFNLSSGVFIYEAVTKQRMAICYTYDNLTTSIGSFIGSIIGATLIKFDFGLSPILFIFIVGFFVRISSVIIFESKVKEIREVKNIDLSIISNVKRYINPMELIDSNEDHKKLN